MANNLLRVTGMISGMDTESIINMYSSKARKNLDTAKGKKQLNNWTQDAWKDLNTKIYSFYSKTLSNNRMSAAYKKTKTTTSDDALSVTGGSNAAQGTQSVKIGSMATSAYLTGATVKTTDEEGGELKSSDNLNEKLGIGEGAQLSFKLGDGPEKKIQIGGSSDDENVTVVKTMDELTSALRNAGVNANFDEANQRLFVSSKTTGAKNNFEFSSDETQLLSKLGIEGEGSHMERGKSASLTLNGAEFTSESNSFTINGSTYTINHEPTDKDKAITVNTTTDYDGIYDTVKSMLKEYNSLVNEMSKLYNAESSKGYDPLTDEQKEAMSDKEVEDWEKKIKDSLLRGDATLNDVMSAITNTTNMEITVNGKAMRLTDFGISTQSYFTAEVNERYALHIDGDADDEVSAANADKLKDWIAKDPEAVSDFFSQLSANLYNNIYQKMSGNSKMSSIYKVYNDKQMKQESSDWDEKIAALEDKVTEIEDKWYSRFAAMETKLAKLQKNQTAVGGFFGS